MDKRICPWWLAYTFDNPLRSWLHDPQKILSPYLSEGMTAVDLGCGMGFFSRGMAKIVGAGGRVISVDLQQEMLDVTRKRALRDGVAGRIRLHRAVQGDIGVTEQADLVLAFWMAHEVADERTFFKQIFAILKPSGTFLIAEPRVHVSRARFEELLSLAREAGFAADAFPRIGFSRAVALKKQ
jgi:ubiquinone/menaquinone biosynthesis C-methylase UbiE